MLMCVVMQNTYDVILKAWRGNCKEDIVSAETVL